MHKSSANEKIGIEQIEGEPTKLEQHDFRILVLDDEPDCLESMADILRFEGYQVSCAGRSIDALKLIEESVPDLLLADVMLDDMSGFDVLRKVRSSSSSANLAVIFLSGLAFNHHQSEAVELDFLEYLVKPVNYDQLFSLINGLRKTR